MAELAFARLHRADEREGAARRRRGRETGDLRDAQAPSDGEAEHDAAPERLAAASAGGETLAPALRADLERAFGRDLGHVRVHTDEAAQQATTGRAALALTRGAHIFLAAPASARNKTLMAHELAHTVQQGAAPPLRLAAAAPSASTRVPQIAPAAPAPAAAAQPAQALDIWGTARSVGGGIASGIRRGAGALVDAGAELMSLSKDALLAVVRRVAPDFMPMFEGDGIGGFLRKLIERGLKSLFDGLMAPLRGIIDVDGLKGQFKDAVAWLGQIGDRLARNDCSGILEAAAKVRKAFSDTLKPVIDKVKEITKDVDNFFHDLWQSIGLPIMDVLKRIGGEIWDSLKGFVGDIAAMIREVRSALGGAWQKVKGWLGIGAEDGEAEGGGLWNWVRDKAKAVGDSISDAVKPALGPLRKIGGGLLLVLPGGQLFGILLLWPELKQGFEALTKYWDDLNLIPRAREAVANVVIPRLAAGAEDFGQTLIAGADWLLEKLDAFDEALGSVAAAATGWLAPMRKLIDLVLGINRRFIGWARDKLKWLSTNLHSLLRQVVVFLGKVADALKDLIAAVVNPFGIAGFLAGHLWLALPECLKGPIIEFLLDLLDGFIKALPENPLLGLLWPVMKAALTGFVAKVRQVELKEKIELADKIAKIISGQSFDFAIGFLKGIVTGVFKALVAPFTGLAAIFDLPSRIEKFLSNLGVSFCEVVEQIRCFLAGLAQSVFGGIDELLGTLQEYLEDPSKIVDLLTCAAKSVLSAARTLGETLADEMIKIFRETEEKLGERLGEFTGGLIVDAVVAYFTAGTATGASIAGKLAELLGEVGKAVAQVIKFITEQMGKLIKWVKELLSSIGKVIVKGAKSIFGKMKKYFGKVFAWFKRLFRRLRQKFGSKGGKADTLVWVRFKLQLKALALRHALAGVTRTALNTEVAQLRTGEAMRVVRFARVAALPRLFRPFWVVKAKKQGLLRRLWLALKVDVLQDRDARWPRGVKRVLSRIKRLKANENNEARLRLILAPIAKKWHFTELRPQFNAAEDDFDIIASMSPHKKIAKTGPKGLHSGRGNDPIPILWYKPRDAYVDPISLRQSPTSNTRIDARMVGNTTVFDRSGAARRIGISSGNEVKRRKKMTLTGTNPLDRARPESRKMGRLLSSLKFNMNNRDVDHVRDLAFGGHDSPSNLWPLRRSTNQIASTQGHWYSGYRIRFKNWVPGVGWEAKETPIGRMTGKTFCVAGFEEGTPATGGKGSCGRV